MLKLIKQDPDFIGGLAVALIGAVVLIYLCRTNKPPVIDANTIDYQTYQEVSYELKGDWVKYAEGVYNRKYNGQ
jgi:hypothetical protein